MSGLYLTGITLTQFRSFAKLNITLPGQPGVLIVHGSNGLGKSSLFDALEWALTDNIDHFRRANDYKKAGSYLCRWGGQGPTSAALTFSNGEQVERRLTSARARRSSLQGVDDIVKLLRAPEWKQPIKSIDRYLMLTHFLGQSTLSRLTHRSADERFTILKEAAQSAELEAFGVALHGKASNLAGRAFTKRLQDLADDTATLSQALEQEAVLWRGAQASGALAQADALDLSQRIHRTVGRTYIDPAASTPLPTHVDASALQLVLDDATQRLTKRREAIDQARLVLVDQRRQDAAQAIAAAALEAARRDDAAARAAAEAFVADVRTARAVQDAALERAAQEKVAHSHLVALKQSRQEVDRLDDARHGTDTLAAAAQARLAAADAALSQATRRAQIVARLEDAITTLDNEAAERQDAITSLNLWAEHSARIDVLETQLVTILLEHPDLPAAIASAEGALREAEAHFAVQQSAAEQFEASVDVMTGAIAGIAANLPEDACDCPVCATPFADAAQLRRRVEDAAARLAPALTAQQALQTIAAQARDKAKASLSTLADALDRKEGLSGALAAEQMLNRDLLARLGLAHLETPESVHSHLIALQSQQELATLRRRRRRRWRDRLAQSAGALDEAARRRDGAHRQVAAVDRQRIDQSTAIEAAKSALAAALAVLPGAPPDETALAAMVDRHAESLAEADAALAVAGSETAAAETQLAMLHAAAASAKARLDIAEANEKSIASALEGFGARWQALGWPETGTEEPALLAAEQAHVAAQAALEEARLGLRSLREGLEAQARQDSHRDALERLRSLTESAPNSDRVQVRAAAAAKLEARRKQLVATTQARDIARAASSEIATQVDEFNSDYIDPLDRLMKRINRAILCDKRVGIDLHVDKRKIAQSASPTGDVPAGIDPLLVHSEGQLAALAVSMLSAASLTYPWSRWRAMVLDDPLQHNDAIHAAAFADLIGSMVQSKAYQIFLSTHDLAQAEFLQRKFDARNIPCATLTLLGRGEEGVRWDFRPARGDPLRPAANA